MLIGTEIPAIAGRGTAAANVIAKKVDIISRVMAGLLQADFDWGKGTLTSIRMRVRFDYVGKAKAGKIWGGKSGEQIAEELRQQKASLIRNVPIQGIQIEDLDMSQEVYSIYDDIMGKSVYYAPVTICFSANSLEDAVKFTMKEEFRTVELLDPQEIILNKGEIEKLMLKVCEELMEYREYLGKKIDNWK